MTGGRREGEGKVQERERFVFSREKNVFDSSWSRPDVRRNENTVMQPLSADRPTMNSQGGEGNKVLPKQRKDHSANANAFVKYDVSRNRSNVSPRRDREGSKVADKKVTNLPRLQAEQKDWNPSGRKFARNRRSLTSQSFHVRHCHPEDREFVRLAGQRRAGRHHVGELGDVGGHLVPPPPLDLAMILPAVSRKTKPR